MPRYEKLIEQADHLAHDDKIDEAIQLYNKAIKSEPEQVSAYYNLALLHHAQNDLDGAISNFKKIAELDPNDASVFNNLGVLYYSKEMLEEAEVSFKKAIEITPDYQEALYGLGNGYLKQERIYDAIVAFQECLKFEPSSEKAKAKLEECYEKRNLESVKQNYKKKTFGEGQTITSEFENQLIDETVLLLTYTDQSQGGLGQRGNPMLHVWYDLDDNWYGPLCQVFSRVYRYDVWHRANRVGVAEANREIIRIAEMYRPKYVLWPATTFTVTEDTLMTLRKIGCVVVGRFFDDDHRFDNYSKWLIPSLDYCITHVPKRVPQYESLGARCILMVVEGHNEGIWQRPAHISKQFDVSFVGAVMPLYPDRRDYLRALTEMGISVRVFDNKSMRNRLMLSDMIGIINQSRINLNFTLDGAGLGIKQLKGRMFEITMAGGFLLTEYAPDLERYFEIGSEVVCFDSAIEAAEKVRYYLQHPDEREEIAARGYERAQRDYTGRAFFREVFLQIEEDLQKRGRAMPGERLVGMNPMRQTAAEYHYKWAQLLLRTPAPLRDAWRESIELALVNNPAHEEARRMLKTNHR